MTRIIPDEDLINSPCSVVAVTMAKRKRGEEPIGYPLLREDGYASLYVSNQYIRLNFPVKKRTDYKKADRPKLKDLHIEKTAIVCVLGHLIYVDGDTYYSFFDNNEDSVVAVWELK